MTDTSDSRQQENIYRDKNMIYTLTFSSEEVENFRLVFAADSGSSFLELHKAILAAAKYTDDQMTSFFMCNDRWEKEQEVTLVEMDRSFEYDNMIMEDTRLEDLLHEKGDRLIYIFDPMFERYFFGRLTDMKAGHQDGVTLKQKQGKAPKQLQTEQDFEAQMKKSGMDLGMDEEFYGDSQYEEGDIDAEGFQDLSFEDGSMF